MKSYWTKKYDEPQRTSNSSTRFWNSYDDSFLIQNRMHQKTPKKNNNEGICNDSFFGYTENQRKIAQCLFTIFMSDEHDMVTKILKLENQVVFRLLVAYLYPNYISSCYILILDHVLGLIQCHFLPCPSFPFRWNFKFVSRNLSRFPMVILFLCA